jgi:hypothetical protein
VDPRLAPHNLHVESLDTFRAEDPQLRRLARQALSWEASLLGRLPRAQAGIYTLGGARQVGKTTLAKQWMARLLSDGADPGRVTYLTGELADDHHVLHRWLEAALAGGDRRRTAYVVVDEITYVRAWDRAVKFLADAGALERAVLLLTGSDLGLLRDVRTHLPGRRGRAEETDFHLHPLTWLEAAEIKGTLSDDERSLLSAEGAFDARALSQDAWERCERELDEFLIHGGFLTALESHVGRGGIDRATLATYGDWIRGDMLKRGKSEGYLRDVLAAWVRRLGAQVTWNALARDLRIDHPATVADYLHLLERMDALFIQPALDENALRAAPKKARKLIPTDPFVLHAVRHLLEPASQAADRWIGAWTADPERAAALVEAVVVEHAHRHWPTYYLKGSRGEVDVAVVEGRTVLPLEVKWRSHVRPEDFRAVAGRRHALVAARTRSTGEIDGVTVLPLPRVLACLSLGRWPAAPKARTGSKD